jgi:hypothetical protein
VGTYKCGRSNCKPAALGDTTWLSTVAKSATNGGYTITISNFDNSNTTVTASIDSLQSIIIDPGIGVSGINAKGNYAGGVIKLNFTTYSTGGGGYTCDMHMIKQ